MSAIALPISMGVCPDCEREVNVRVVKEHATSWQDDVAPVDGADTYWILECGGCGRVFFGHGSQFSEDIDFQFDPVSGEWHQFLPVKMDFFPKTANRTKPSWFTEFRNSNFGELPELLEEVYCSLDNGLNTLTAIGLRTVLEVVSVSNGAKRSATFKEKIEHLRKEQYITGRERDFLEILADAGGAAAHRSWKPKPDELNTMLEMVESLIHRISILPEKAMRLKKTVPPKAI